MRLWLASAVLPAELVPERIERTRGGDGGIELADRAGGGVARAGEEREPGCAAFGVELLEAALRHVDLAAYLEAGGEARAGDAARDGADGADVLGDVLAARAVAAGGGGDEAAVLEDEGAGEAVDLGLADHREVGALDDVRGALVPGAEAVGVEGVGEREQGTRCSTMPKVSTGAPPTRCVGESGVISSGWRASSVAQFDHELVEVGVGDLGLVEDEVAVLVVGDLRAELLDAELGLLEVLGGVGLLLRHGYEYRGNRRLCRCSQRGGEGNHGLHGFHGGD